MCPIMGEGKVTGLGISSMAPGDTRRIMDGDPAVRVGVQGFEAYPAVGLPGDASGTVKDISTSMCALKQLR